MVEMWCIRLGSLGQAVILGVFLWRWLRVRPVSSVLGVWLWGIALVAALLVVFGAWMRHDGVLLGGQLCVAVLYGRELILSRRRRDISCTPQRLS